MTGVFECGITLVFCLIKRVKETDFNGSVGFGIGFGGIEAFLLGLNSFLTVIVLLFIPEKLPQNILENLLTSFSSPLLIPMPIIERISALFIHIFSCVLIILSVKKKSPGWFWVSFIYKTFVDGLAGYFIFTKGKDYFSTVSQGYLFELYFILLALLGILGIVKIKKFFDRV